jgi:hypothetical protein
MEHKPFAIGAKENALTANSRVRNRDNRFIANPFDGKGKLDERAEPRRKAMALTRGRIGKFGSTQPKRIQVEDEFTVRTGPKKGELIAKLGDDRRHNWSGLGMSGR